MTAYNDKLFMVILCCYSKDLSNKGLWSLCSLYLSSYTSVLDEDALSQKTLFDEGLVVASHERRHYFNSVLENTYEGSNIVC